MRFPSPHYPFHFRNSVLRPWDHFAGGGLAAPVGPGGDAHDHKPRTDDGDDELEDRKFITALLIIQDRPKYTKNSPYSQEVEDTEEEKDFEIKDSLTLSTKKDN